MRKLYQFVSISLVIGLTLSIILVISMLAVNIIQFHQLQH